MIQDNSQMKFNNLIHILPLILLLTLGCSGKRSERESLGNVRQLVDTIGFAQYSWQMDSIMTRLDRKGWTRTEGESWKLAICPHDDYTYAGKLYPIVLSNIRAPLLILLGVAHKAARMGIEDSLVFDTYDYWKGPWKNVRISPFRDEIYSRLSAKFAIISDTLHSAEHSLESMIPFLQYFNRDVSIIPVLVPAMKPERMKECGFAMANAIREVAKEHNLQWGKDFSIIVTTDAVHYGNEDWGGSDMAPFGCDILGNGMALAIEKEIMQNCLTGSTTPEKISLFNAYTLKPDNYKEYKWTWCGRYCVPVALYTAYYLNNENPLSAGLTDYSTSIMSEHIKVDDIGMGSTAIATPCHWVGYAAIAYK